MASFWVRTLLACSAGIGLGITAKPENREPQAF